MNGARTHTHTHSHTHTLPDRHTHTHTNKLTNLLSLSFSLSYTHTQTHTYTPHTATNIKYEDLNTNVPKERNVSSLLSSNLCCLGVVSYKHDGSLMYIHT